MIQAHFYCYVHHGIYIINFLFCSVLPYYYSPTKMRGKCMFSHSSIYTTQHMSSIEKPKLYTLDIKPTDAENNESCLAAVVTACPYCCREYFCRLSEEIVFPRLSLLLPVFTIEERVFLMAFSLRLSQSSWSTSCSVEVSFSHSYILTLRTMVLMFQIMQALMIASCQ